MQKISKQEAANQNLIYYYTGKKCKNGHDSERFVKGGMCKQCKKEYGKKYRGDPLNSQKISTYFKNRHKKIYSTEKRRIDYSNNLEANMLYRAKKRARNKNIEFDLTIDDIFIPDLCPILGVPIVKVITGKKEYSPSLDRIDRKRGYVKNNIMIISNRANRLKSDATLEELEKIIDYMKLKGI